MLKTPILLRRISGQVKVRRRQSSNVKGSWDIGNRDFWKCQYNKKDLKTFDWLAGAQIVSDEVMAILDDTRLKNSNLQHINVLDLGCGTSVVSNTMYKTCQFPLQLFCLDYAVDALNYQRVKALKQSRGHHNSNMFYINGDATQLPFVSNLFDVIIDKGTTDSLLRIHDGATDAVTKCLSESLNCLTSDGAIFQITDEDPDTRFTFIETILKRTENPNCNISFRTLSSSNNFEYFMYVIRQIKT